MVDIKDVTIARAGRTLFTNLNFSIRKGEHWVIQGNNGAGKTTLLQLVAGALTPLRGTINHSFIVGDDWDTRYQQRMERIHFIPTHWMQSALSGAGEVYYQQRYYSIDETGIPKVSEIFGEDLEKLSSLKFPDNFNIHRLLTLPITRLSNGQLKKVIILRQLVRNIPTLLILDYPFDGLDAESRMDLCDFIDDIATRFGIHILLTEHGDSLPSVINRRLVLENFEIREIADIVPQRQVASIPPRTPGPIGSSGDPIVEMRNVTISYGGTTIISNLNWRIQKGERWALTGKNGSGKTTLFSLIFADHPMAYSQQVFLFGKRRGSGESIWDIKERINYLGPEQIHFLNHRTRLSTGRSFITGQKHSDPERLNNLITSFSAEEYIDVPMAELSSGQLQMVLLMNMFLDDKELLLLDEPFQFLDPDNHDRITQYLNHYLNENVTLIMITHHEKDVARWTQLRKVL